MRIYKGETFADAYELGIKRYIDNPNYLSSPRGMKIMKYLMQLLVIEDPSFVYMRILVEVASLNILRQN